MLDKEGYRPNVGIILANQRNEVFWGKRVNQHAWQFPQGGIKPGETPLQAMYRELHEETGLSPGHVDVLDATPGWLRYRLPRRCVRVGERPICIGQKQVWFLLRLVGAEHEVRLDLTDKPEFDQWRWVDFWYPLEHVVNFKRRVYAQALHHLAHKAHSVADGAAILNRAPPPLDERDRRDGVKRFVGGRGHSAKAS